MAGRDWIDQQEIPKAPAKAQIRSISADNFSEWGRVLSGVDVGNSNVVEMPAAFRAIDLISGALGFVEFTVEQLSGEAYRKREDHPLYRVMNVSANEQMDSFFARKLLATWYLIHCECYALLSFNERGQIREMLPLRNDCVYDDVADPVNYILYVFPDGKSAQRFNRKDVLHVRWMATARDDKGRGVAKARSIANLFGSNLGAAKLQTEYLKKFYENGAAPGGILYHVGDLGEGGRGELLREWNKAHQGVTNAHRIAILEASLKYEPLKPDSIVDQDFVRLAGMSVQEVSRIWGVPLHMLSVPEGSKYATAEQTAKEFMSFCMRNHFAAFTSAIRHTCLSRYEQGITRIGYDEQALASVSFSDVVEGLSKATTGGIMTRNEARAKMGLGPIAGGDELLVQQQMIPASMAGEGQANAA